jgi:hypothetical protein
VADASITLTPFSRWGDDGKIVELIDMQVTAIGGQNFFVILRDPMQLGIHYFNKEFTPSSWAPVPNEVAIYQRPGATYFTGPKHMGKLVLTRADWNTGRLILSGTLEFEAQDPKTGEVVEVTDGRFDVRM